MIKHIFFLIIVQVAQGAVLPAQSNFGFILDPISVPAAPALQSFASGHWNGEWLLLGGRKDGLHRRQPFAAFDEAAQNDRIYVLNPETKQVWSAPLTGLPAAIAEQLRSTNLQAAQRDSILYLTGGYGYSATAAQHLTYPQLLAVNMPGIIRAIRENGNLAPYIRMLTDQRMAVSGGQMATLNGRFFLAGGHRFDGQYNPMNHPTFTQEYTNEVRIFDIADNGATLAISNYTAWRDTQHLHRRDYNLAPAIFPDGHPGLTVFSGVFQYNDDLPWLYPVDIDSAGYTPHPEFAQYLNHYHCAHVSLFDEQNGQQHTVFFGGMAEYTLDPSGILIQDINVPFVRTIARVTRHADGSLEEVKLPVEMPELLGSGAEFFVHPDIPVFSNGVIRVNDLPGDSILLGYIFGGIRSPQPNIFFTNVPSEAMPTVYRVWWLKNTTETAALPVTNPLRMRISPSPSTGDMLVNYWLPKKAAVRIRLYGASGRLLGEFDEGERTEGVHWIKLEASGMPKGIVLVNLLAGDVQVSQKVLLE